MLCENRPALKKLLVEHRPTRKHGRPRNEDTETDNNVNGLLKPQGNSRQYIEQRLSRDFPKFWKDYLNGKYKSARQDNGRVVGRHW